MSAARARALAPVAPLLVALLVVGARTGQAQGLTGYIGSATDWPPEEYTAGVSFYAPVWSMVDSPIAGFQIGLPGTWVTPDNHDDTSDPLCPQGTFARNNWPDRGPTYDGVFQTVEGGIGYWVGNRFHYGSPKFSMNGTPDCYTHQIASPGWQFFSGSEPLPDNFLGIAQLSNRILVPPDGLTFAGQPSGELLGYGWMALPLTSARSTPQPTGNQSWTLFLAAANFRGPVAYYLPETWSRMIKDYDFPSITGRGLDSRRCTRGLSGTIEIGSVPILSQEAGGKLYTKIPRLKFPVDASGETLLTRDVTAYSRAALYDAVAAWRLGAPAPSGRFETAGSYKARVTTWTPSYGQQGEPVSGINEVATTAVLPGNAFGLAWQTAPSGGFGYFPQYFVEQGGTRVAVAESAVPPELRDAEFSPATPGPAYDAPLTGAWANPAAGPFEVVLRDGSRVTYYWYRFIDQPVFRQYAYSGTDRNALQALVEGIHRSWTPDRTYIAEPSGATLASLDTGLLVTPPPGLEVGYVPIVVHQEQTRCLDDETTVCLGAGGRFKVRGTWSRYGAGGVIGLAALSRDSAVGDFGNRDNKELLVKVLDGRALGGHFWVFLNAASDVAMTVTVTDVESGEEKSYVKSAVGPTCAVTDTAAFPNGTPTLEFGGGISPTRTVRVLGAAERDALLAGWGSSATLDGGYIAHMTWSRESSGGEAHFTPASAVSAYVDFGDPANREFIVKALDGSALGGHEWLFAAGATDVAFRLEVLSGLTLNTYEKPVGTTCAITDTAAFVRGK
jgi:hypothetical protein